MTLVQLRHFLSLADTGSFTRSAQALHLTQPALSRSIRALEAALGGALFDRVGRRSELTHFGRELLEQARHLVHEAGQLALTGERLRAGHASTLRVGLGSGPGALLSTPLLLRASAPDTRVRVEILHSDNERLIEALQRRLLDAVVIEMRSFTADAGLRIEPLVQMRGAFLCRPGHPLTRRRRTLGFDDLQKYPIASTPLGDHVGRGMVAAYGPQGHPDVCVRLRCNELTRLVELTRHSDAVLLAIRAAAPDLVELPVQPQIEGGARFGLVTQARRQQAPALPLLREVIAAHLHD
ncbi:LysR family transcriptional regulator [Pseudacidovorax sp. RU35E]|uniref:LysR family transcriptional regulator n=1 Tax=Pseudacidovorax sp. RU35E TaxID=1907403 RepID=UPI0009562DAC|nr:LysR family transcriptional regulator [Pseudacidovorax sp. RU35E]SIR19810.1 DNA-binding transcriptional regulator, LysR family [Pseudacidovorax sp. RU35E]